MEKKHIINSTDIEIIKRLYSNGASQTSIAAKTKLSKRMVHKIILENMGFGTETMPELKKHTYRKTSNNDAKVRLIVKLFKAGHNEVDVGKMIGFSTKRVNQVLIDEGLKEPPEEDRGKVINMIMISNFKKALKVGHKCYVSTYKYGDGWRYTTNPDVIGKMIIEVEITGLYPYIAKTDNGTYRYEDLYIGTMAKSFETDKERDPIEYLKEINMDSTSK